MGKLLRRLGYWLRYQRRGVELADEIEAHRAMRQQELERSGMSVKEAAIESKRLMGNTLLAREGARDVWGWNLIDDAWRDMRAGIHDFRRAPGFWISASLILSLGIGVNVAAFQVLDAVFWKPLEIREPHTLVRLFRGNSFGTFPYLSVPALEANTSIFSALLARSNPRAEVGGLVWGNDPANKPMASFVSSNWFEELGYRPIRGRLFRAGLDDAPNAEPGVIISEVFWKRRLDSDPEIVGKQVRLNNRVATVLGIVSRDVMPPSYDTMVWMPLTQVNYFEPGTELLTSWRMNGVQVYGRLRSGVPIDAVRQAVQPAMDELIRQHPDDFPGWLQKLAIAPAPASTHFDEPALAGVRWIVPATGFFLTLLILLIACTNLINLVLSRAVSRVRDLSVRAALGASRWRILRQLLGESALLVFISSVGGLFLVYCTTRIFVLFAPDLPGIETLSFNWRTIAATLVTGALAIVAVGLLPAWKISSSDLMAAIKDGGQQASAGLRGTRWRNVLIAGQIGCSCVFLVLTGNILHSLQGEMSGPVVNVENVAELTAPLQLQGITGNDALSYWSRLQDEIKSHPQTAATALVSRWGSGVVPVPGLLGPAGSSEVGPGFFEVMKIPILSGREFEAADQIGSSVIISRQLALKMYGRLNVVGERFPKDEPRVTIVGVADDVRFPGDNAPDLAALYRPLNPESAKRKLLVRARSNPAGLPPLLTRMARDLNADVIPDAYLLSRESNLCEPGCRLSRLFSVLGLMALSITCVGIFGTVSFAAMLRRQEIGIRLAIGATRTSVILLLLRVMRWPLIGGVVLGLAAAIPSGLLFIDNDTFEDPFDPAVMAIVAIFLAIVTAIAAVLPALRSLRSNPLRALRSE